MLRSIAPSARGISPAPTPVAAGPLSGPRLLAGLFGRLSLGTAAPAPRTQIVANAKVCQLTGKRNNRAFNVTFSHKRNKRVQHPNLQYKMVYWPAGQRYVRLRISTDALRTIDKKGLDSMAKDAGIDLWKLPFRDARTERREWLAASAPHDPPLAKDRFRMRDPVKLAASRKSQTVPRYYLGRIVWVKKDRVEQEGLEKAMVPVGYDGKMPDDGEGA